MPDYRLLLSPSANRVYARCAPTIALAELATLSALSLGGRLGDVRSVETPAARFVGFTTDEPISTDDRRVVGALSSAYVLFEVRGDLLAPVPLNPPACFPDDLLTTLKYAGKTNEQFTALLLNLALAATKRGFPALLAGERVRVLDPLCGRGTTLNQALMYGLDAAGVEVQAKDFETYSGFVLQWLRDHRIKHRSENLKLRKGRPGSARRTTVTITRPDDDTGSPGDAAPRDLVLDLVNDDTLNAREHLGGSSVDLVVGDLPYGIQHASRTDEWGGSRNPAGLLEAALPVWRSVLRGGGSLCLAFNCNMVARPEVEQLVAGAGLRLVDLPEGVAFEHRVDRTIRRDLVLAVKPS